MKINYRKVALLSVICAGLYTTSFAQINAGGKLKEVGKKLESQTEEKAEKKLDDKIDHTLNTNSSNQNTSSWSGNSTSTRDDNYKGPAKVQVKGFWNQIDILKSGKGKDTQISNAERFLKDIKEKDPSYNTSGMEEELNKYRAGISKQVVNSSIPEEQTTELKTSTTSGYAGPAKNNIESFWRNGSKSSENMSENELNIAIGNMQNSLNRTKEKDPAYNISEMETILEKFKNKKNDFRIANANKNTGDKVNDSQQNQSISNDAGKLIQDLFENENLQAGAGMVTGEKLRVRIEKYNEKVVKLLSMDYVDAKISHARTSKGTINGMKMITDRKLNDMDVMLSKFRDKESMEIGYYTIHFHLVYWDATQKVFSEESSYKEMYQKVKAASDKIGSLESMMAKADGNNTQYIKDTKLPPPVVRDASLEKVLMDGFNKKFTSQYGATALKVVLTQDGWTTLRNPINSAIIGRERSAKIAYKDKDGKCNVIIDYVFIKEEYIGGAFTNTKPIFNGLDGKEMLCENIK
jgi:hypothetical protein